MSAAQPVSPTRLPRLSLRFLLAIYAPPVALLALAVIVSKHIGIECEVFLRDPAHLAHVPCYTGIISNLGIAVWCAGGVMALFAVALPKTADRREDRRFLLWSGLLTLYLRILLHHGNNHDARESAQEALCLSLRSFLNHRVLL